MKILLSAFVVVCTINISSFGQQQRFWISNQASDWNNADNWSTTSGGIGGASIPGIEQIVIFDASGSGDCLLNGDVVVNGISLTGYTGTINLNGFDMTTTGTNLFASGAIGNAGSSELILNTPSTTTFSGTVFNIPVTGSTGRVFFNGSEFYNPVTITKTSIGSDPDESTGNNIFHAVVNITTIGHGIIMGKGMRDQFEDVVTFTNNGTYRFELANSHSGQTTTFATDVIMNANKSSGPDGWAFRISPINNSSVLFGGDLFINCSGTEVNNFIFLDGPGSSANFAGNVTINISNSNPSTKVYMGTKGTSSYQGDISINNGNGSGGVFFNTSTSASSTLAAGKNILIGGDGFGSGDLQLSRFNQQGATNQTLVLTGNAKLTVGPNSQFGGNVTFTAPRLRLDGANYIGTAILTKTGAGNDGGDGGNVFATTAELSNTGSGYLLTANTSSDTFYGNLTANTTGAGAIYLAHKVAGNAFHGNVIVNSVNGGGVYFSSLATGSATFDDNSTISVGDDGFNSGVLKLFRLTLTAPQSIQLATGGSAILTLGQGTVFMDDFTATAPGLVLGGADYRGTATLTKTGSSHDVGSGGNTFHEEVTLLTSGSGHLTTATTAADVFFGNLTVTTTGAGTIRLADNVAGNVFNGNVVVNSVDGGGVSFSSGANGSSTFGASSTISVGPEGFDAGLLRLFRLTLAAPQSLLLDEDGSAILTLGQGTVFANTVIATAPSLLLNGSTYQGAATLTKTGNSNNDGLGGNTFNTDVSLINSGAGYLRTAHYMPDVFNVLNGSLTVTTTGLGTIQLANTVAGTQFNGDIILNSSNNGAGIYFSNSTTASSTLASGRTVTLGAFNSGEIRICRFTQSGAAPITLNLGGTSSILRVGPSTVFGGNVDLRAPRLYLNGISVAGNAYLQKNGAATDNSSGGNSFSGATTIVNSGSGDLSLGNTLADVFTGDLIASNTGSARILLANNSANNIFNGNVIVNSTSGSGIYFCNDTNATASFSNGQIQVGTDGFSSGQFRLRKFTQTGNTPQTITLSGSAILVCGPQTTWYGNVAFSAPGITLENTTFNGNTTSITKTGSGTNSSPGGNTFASATTTITNSGSGTFRLGNTTGDTFSGNVTFSVSNGALEPAFNGTSLFSSSITFDNTVAITIGAGTGTLLFGGSNGQSINRTGTGAVTFRRFTLNKEADHVTLNTPVNVSSLGTFTNGNIITSTTNLLNFSDGAITSGGSNSSYVDGPVRKTGNEAFSFPTGDDGVCRPIAISAPSTASHHFTAQYFKQQQTYGTAMATDIDAVSGCEYWTLDRTNGSSNVNVTLTWNSADCTGEYISEPNDLRVMRWNGSVWNDHGNGGTTGNAAMGSITSASPVSSFSPFTLGSISQTNALPVELVSLSAAVQRWGVELNWSTASELNNDYFSVERSENGIDFDNLATIKGAGTSAIVNKYQFLDETPFSPQTYYRVKQTDFDQKYVYSSVIVVKPLEGTGIHLHPNPVSRGSMVFTNRKSNYTVVNDLGIVVMRVIDTSQIDTASLLPGLFIVKAENGEAIRMLVTH